MAKVIDKCSPNTDRLTIICDFSPPRGANETLLQGANSLDVDFLCLAYSPGRSVRVDSAIAAHVIKERLGRDVIFTLATRDMNKLAIQNHLLGASLLGLDNVLVVGGDNFTERDLTIVKGVSDYTPSELIKSVKAMNHGEDYRGLKLRSPTDFCVGATIDLSRGIEREAKLTHRKVLAGADFLITQPVYDIQQMLQFLHTYELLSGNKVSVPIFLGLQVLDLSSLVFGEVPETIKQDLEYGRTGVDIAAELLCQFLAAGVRNIYLIPTILRGGLRNYTTAQMVVETYKAMS